MPEIKKDDPLERWRTSVVDYFTKIDKTTLRDVQRGITPKTVLLAAARRYLKAQGVKQDSTIHEILVSFDKYVFGYGPLEDLINDPDISDIKITRPDCVRIKTKGIRSTSTVRFRDADAVNRYTEYVAVKNHVSVSDMNAVQSVTDKDSNKDFILRIDISTPFVNSVPNAYIQIRKIPKNKALLGDLVAANMLPQPLADQLSKAASTASGILFCGKGGSGKTSLMNALIEEIPHDRSGLVIQENEELFSETHPDLMFQHIVEARGEGKIEYTLQDLARNGLLLDLDYFLIGEVKGGEARYMMNAAYTGHRCWATIHANNSREAIRKLVDYVKYASDYSTEDATRMLLSLNTIIFLEDYQVKEVSKIQRYDETAKELRFKTVRREGGEFVNVE